MSETIIRTHKNKSNPYFIASKALFEDKRLSWAARGLMGYLLAKPDDWKIKASDLQANGDCGRDGIKAILRELERCGYLYRQRVNKGGGKFDWLFEIYESPSLNPHALESPSPENPSMVEPSTPSPSMVEPSPVEPSPVKASIYQLNNKLNTQVLDRFSIACTVEKTPFARRGASSCTSTPYIQMKTDLNTHTHKAAPAAPAPGVRVRSKFSLEVCRGYAEHLKAKGEGITNPGGYAMTIYRSGEVDAQIEQWLHPESAPRKLDARDCPDCSGRGVRYVDPANFDRGVTPCRHEKLAQQVAVGVG